MLPLIASLSACSRIYDYPQVAVVEKYRSLDAQGANFDSRDPNMKVIGQLLVNEDEAGYDSSVVIASSRISKMTSGDSTADVEVIYQDLGVMDTTPSFQSNRRAETMNFHLTKIGGAWKIDGLRQPPHISKAWALSMLRKELASTLGTGKQDPGFNKMIEEISRE